MGTHRLLTPAITLLNTRWQPVDRLDGHVSLQQLITQSLRLNIRWIMLEQHRETANPRPSATDVMMTRTLRRRLRPLEIGIADHLLHGHAAAYSFRVHGLL